MSTEPHRFIFLSGAAGGGDKDIAAFADGLEYPVQFETVPYPGWRRYIQQDFSPDALIAELSAEVQRRVPTGAIGLLGLSLGGHLGYHVALHLQAQGREIALFCAIDSFMVASAQPSAGWTMRALSDAAQLLRDRRLAELARFLRSRAWRALLRLAGGNLSAALRVYAAAERLPSVFKLDGLAEQELSMRLLLRELAPWLAALDRNPTAMTAPAVLLRTRPSAAHDADWRRRCPNLVVREVAGKHLTLFEPENIGGLRRAFIAATGDLPPRACAT